MATIWTPVTSPSEVWPLPSTQRYRRLTEDGQTRITEDGYRARVTAYFNAWLSPSASGTTWTRV